MAHWMIFVTWLVGVPRKQEHLVGEGSDWVVELRDHRDFFPDSSGDLGSLSKGRVKGIPACVLVGE